MTDLRTRTAEMLAFESNPSRDEWRKLVTEACVRVDELEAALRDGECLFRKPATGENAQAEISWLESARRLLGK